MCIQNQLKERLSKELGSDVPDCYTVINCCDELNVLLIMQMIRQLAKNAKDAKDVENITRSLHHVAKTIAFQCDTDCAYKKTSSRYTLKVFNEACRLDRFVLPTNGPLNIERDVFDITDKLASLYLEHRKEIGGK